MKEILEKLEKEIVSVKETQREIEDERWKEKLKGVKYSTARKYENKIDDERLAGYLNGLVIAKLIIEKEMNK